MEVVKSDSSPREETPGELGDLNITAVTTPLGEDESHELIKKEGGSIQLKQNKKRSLLDLLVADHDWYVSFESDSSRSGSVKRLNRSFDTVLPRQAPVLTEEQREKKRVSLLKLALTRKMRLEKKQAEAEARLELRILERERQIREGTLPSVVKPTSKSGLQDLMDGASWFNRNSSIDSYTRKIKPKTEWFIIEDDTPQKKKKKRSSTPKPSEEDSRLQSRGRNKRSNDIKKKIVVKKTVVTKKNVKREPKDEIKKQDPVKIEEIETEVVEQEVEEDLFNWFLDLDVKDMIPIKDRRLFIDEIYSSDTISLDYSKLGPDSNDNLVSAAFVITHLKNHYTNNDKFPYTEVSLSTLFSNYKEHYVLSVPKNEELNPFIEIGTNMEITALFLPEIFSNKVRNDREPYNSIVGRYIKAYFDQDLQTILKEIETYNDLIDNLRHTKEFIPHLLQMESIPRSVLHEILNQCYSRTVSPNVQTLRSYKAFSNEVYGELLPSFLSTVYDKTGLDHTKTFIDLGSGVGNCVLQAALEYGSESYGCEIMSNASKLSDLQTKEFVKRCKIFGIKPGYVKNFLAQSFVDNKGVSEAVNKCDVILCNNYLFDADLNAKVVELFRHLKTGTKIITLKPIVPLGYSFNEFDVESILNRLKMEKFSYGFNSVSWTNNGGVYYISEVQQDIVSEYFVEHAKGRTSRTRRNN